MNPAKHMSSTQRLISVDVLRGLAVLAVIAIHVPHYAHGGWRQHPFFFPAFIMDFGYLGVHLFVLISGFCIHLRAAKQKRQTGNWELNWVEFWKRRMWRLYPPYLAAIVFSLIFASTLHKNYPVAEKLSAADVITHVLLIHNLTDDFAGGLGNGAFWSLGMEEQLYALYFILLMLFATCSHRAAVAVVLLISLCWRASITAIGGTSVSLGPLSLGSWPLWPFMFWIHWTLGAVAVDAYFGNIRLPRWCSSLTWSTVFGAAGILLNKRTVELVRETSLAGFLPLDSLNESTWLFLHFVGELGFAAAFFFLINRWVQREKDAEWPSWTTPISSIGRMSYSIYLVHVPVIYALKVWLPIGQTPLMWPVCCTVYAAISIAVGVLFYQMVERHFLSPRTVQRDSSPVRQTA